MVIFHFLSEFFFSRNHFIKNGFNEKDRFSTWLSYSRTINHQFFSLNIQLQLCRNSLVNYSKNGVKKGLFWVLEMVYIGTSIINIMTLSITTQQNETYLLLSIVVPSIVIMTFSKMTSSKLPLDDCKQYL
jgi:hypothetical protein